MFLRGEIQVYVFLKGEVGDGGDYSWRGCNFQIFLHLCLLTTSGASLTRVCLIVRYQVEGIESKKVDKKKTLRRPTNPMQMGLVHGEGCMSRTVLQKILSR